VLLKRALHDLVLFETPGPSALGLCAGFQLPLICRATPRPAP